MRRPLTVAACLAAALACAAPAQAVVGGKPVRASAVPWFAGFVCGGALVAPDRILTAAHCVEGEPLSDLAAIHVGGTVRRGVRVALPPSWERERNAEIALDDLAVVQLDRPVTGVRPAKVATARTRVPKRLRILGRGLTEPGGRMGLRPLHGATLRTVSDRTCAAKYRSVRKTPLQERFVAARMVCATDPDGRGKPFLSVCSGDSGGPLFGGTRARPVLFGVISWVGEDTACGTDRRPSVAAEVDHLREWILAPNPVWAPVPAAPARVSGEARVGGTLTCAVPAWEVAPDRVEFVWRRIVSGTRTPRVGTGATYTVRAADAGHLLGCSAAGVNAGGRTATEPSAESTARVSG